jgi:hypothetical protein
MNPASPGSAVKDGRTTMATSSEDMATSSETKITEWRRVIGTVAPNPKCQARSSGPGGLSRGNLVC